MAIVYRARDETLGREVAVKVLHGHLMAEGESKARLEREAQAVAKLQHDNIVQIFDYSGPHSPSSFIVTEFIEGQTLKQWLGLHQFPYPELAALVVIEVANAVAHAHGVGILHRDIKPENVMVRRDGVLKLMDFGVAQVMDLERMTVTGQLIGSPAYMAPELIEGRPVDVRTDVFALGIMLYQLSTGSLPFAGRNPHEVFKRITDARYPDPRSKNPLIGSQLTKIVARALAREPDDRYPTAQALVDDLRAYASEAGLGETRTTLATFFGNPEGKQAELRPHILSQLTASGAKAQSQKKMALALELWNRALALDPTYPPALMAVRSLERGQRLRRTLVGVAAAGALALGTFAVFKLVPPPATEPPPDSVAEGAGSAGEAPVAHSVQHQARPGPAASPPAPVAALSPSLPAESGSPAELPGAFGAADGTTMPRGEPLRRARQRARTVLQAPAATSVAVPAPTVRFTLGPNPLNVEVYLDGTKQFDFGPERHSLDVPWDGTHVVEFRKRGFYTFKVDVGPSLYRPVNDHITGRLQGLPAPLVVKVMPPGRKAQVLVSAHDGGSDAWQFAALPGQVVRVPFEPGDELRKRLVVTVVPDDAAPQIREITVMPGQPQTLLVELP